MRALTLVSWALAAVLLGVAAAALGMGASGEWDAAGAVIVAGVALPLGCAVLAGAWSSRRAGA